MARPRKLDPVYRKHHRTGRGVVVFYDPIAGRRRERMLPGLYGTPEADSAFHRFVAEYKLTNMPPQAAAPHEVRVNEVLLAFLQFASTYYSKSELGEYKAAMRPVKKLYGLVSVSKFGPLALVACRQEMVTSGISRRVANQRTNRIRRIVKWAVAQEMAAPSVLEALRAVPGLRQGQGGARERPKVNPVSDADVERTLPFLNRHLQGLVRLQRLTGARGGELVQLRAIDVDRTGPVWSYRVRSHKGSWKSLDRVIHFGPTAQKLILEYLTPNVEDFLFSPRAAREEKFAEMRARRRSRVQPSQQSRRVEKPAKLPGLAYTSHAYAGAVRKACVRAGVEPWHPHMLRHLVGTEVRAKFGLEACQCVLGHQHASISETYALRNEKLAAQVASQVG
jgi:integrase